MTSEKKQQIRTQVQKQTSNVVAIASIIALVILLSLEVEIPTYIGVGLIGSALGAKWEEVISAIRGTK